MKAILAKLFSGVFFCSQALALQLGPDPRAPMPASPVNGQMVEGPRASFAWAAGASVVAPQSQQICIGKLTMTSGKGGALVVPVLDCNDPNTLKFGVAAKSRAFALPADLPVVWQGQNVSWTVIACYAAATPGGPPSCVTGPRGNFVLTAWPPRPRPRGDFFQPYFEFKYAVIRATAAQLRAVPNYAALRQLAGPQVCTFVGEVRTNRHDVDARLDVSSYQLDFDVTGAVNTGCPLTVTDWADSLAWFHVRISNVQLESFPPATAANPTATTLYSDSLLTLGSSDRATVQFARANRPAVDFRFQVAPPPPNADSGEPAYVDLRYFSAASLPISDGVEVVGSFGAIATQENADLAVVIFDGSFRLLNQR